MPERYSVTRGGDGKFFLIDRQDNNKRVSERVENRKDLAGIAARLRAKAKERTGKK